MFRSQAQPAEADGRICSSSLGKSAASILFGHVCCREFPLTERKALLSPFKISVSESENLNDAVSLFRRTFLLWWESKINPFPSSLVIVITVRPKYILYNSNAVCYGWIR